MSTGQLSRIANENFDAFHFVDLDENETFASVP